MIEKLGVEEDFMDSRCHPTGLFMEGNYMIVDEAPGQRGRSIGKHCLKPSFIYEKPSYILRNAIDQSFKDMPYITNLLKFARVDNKIRFSDFDKTFHIFEKEVELIQPKTIYALGNNTYKYLSDKYENLVYIKHPASILYNGGSLEEYIKVFRSIVNGN
jgi:hypothetical protein